MPDEATEDTLIPSHEGPRDERQLSLFLDRKRELVLVLIESLEAHGEKIHRLHDLARKVRLGVPGYASPERVKYMRAFRRRLGSTAIKATVRYRPNRSYRS